MAVETYRAPGYAPELVTGKYVRAEGSKRKGYQFKVFETATCMTKGQFYKRPGFGPTLREYITNGSEIPQSVKDAAMASRSTERWE